MSKRIPGKKVSSKISSKAILKSKFKYNHRMLSSGVELKAKLHSLYSFFSCLIARGLKVRILGNQTLKIKIPLPPILPSPLIQEILIIFPLVHFICLYYISTEKTISCLFLHILTTYRCIKWYRCIATSRGKQFFPRFSK